jgi:hypothetical protein
MSTAKSLFIRRESDVWDSLRSQRAARTEANERLAQRSTKVANLLERGWSLARLSASGTNLGAKLPRP